VGIPQWTSPGAPIPRTPQQYFTARRLARTATETAVAKGLEGIPADAFEPLEAMVESIVALCECEPDRTGASYVSLDLLEELGRPARGLDGRDLDATLA
jgi:hypothetical protein